MLFLLFVALLFSHCFLFVFFFPICGVMLALWQPSSIAAHFAFYFTSCVVVLAFWSSQLPILLSVLLVVIESGIGTQDDVSWP